MAVTLREIAKMAGVSTTTVSRVINNKAVGNVSKETYSRIKEIIELTGYSPDPMAAALRSGSSKVIGVILPSSTNPYYAQLGSHIENEAYQNEYLVFICNSNFDVTRERKYITTLKNYKVSGILLCSTGLTSHELKELVPDTTTYVLLDEEIKDYSGDLVLGDDVLGGYKGAEYLYSLGHSNVLIITGPENLLSSQNRLQGFSSFYNERSLQYDSNLIAKGDFTIQSGYEAIKVKRKILDKVTAVFSFNDMMAIGAIQALQEIGISVPNQMSVLGYDNIFLDQYLSPRITTIATPLDELAKTAFQRIIQKKRKHRAARIPPILIERESCERRA